MFFNTSAFDGVLGINRDADQKSKLANRERNLTVVWSWRDDLKCYILNWDLGDEDHFEYEIFFTNNDCQERAKFLAAWYIPTDEEYQAQMQQGIIPAWQ